MNDEQSRGGQADDHGHGHGHTDSGNVMSRLFTQVKHVFTCVNSRDSADIVDDTLEASERGMRALWISFGALMVTAVLQAVLVVFTGSVALLGDTVHNFADALTAVPLAIAFLLGRRAATHRFTAQRVVLAARARPVARLPRQGARRLRTPSR